MSYSLLSEYSLEKDDDYINNSKNESMLEKKRKSLNTTYKRRETSKHKITPPFVESMKQMHNEPVDSDDNDAGAYSHPQLIQKGSNQEEEKQTKESMINMSSNDIMFRTLGRTPEPSSDNYNLNDYSNYGDEKSNEEYYKRVIPGYDYSKEKQQEQEKQDKNTVNRPYYNQGASYKLNNVSLEDSILLQKMNYMITLLEDQQDEKTNNVTEEVILYSFLGIFIIFIADSFVKVGKYVR